MHGRPTDSSTTTEQIRRLILERVYRPGDRLAEVELADRLGVSRTPVREALRQLSTEGLVEIEDRKGARVVSLSPCELENIFELRAEIEGTAARRAATSATPAELDELERIAEEIAVYALPGPDRNLAKVYALNTDFHLGLATAARSTAILNAVESLFHTVAALRTLDGFDEGATRRSVNHHREIVAALRARDGQWAESVMKSHLYSARAAMLGPRPEPHRGCND